MNSEKIRAQIVDDESKKIFDARIQYMKDGDDDRYIKYVTSLYDDYRCRELKEFGVKEEDRIIIRGAGRDGQRVLHVLQLCGVKNEIVFCDKELCKSRIQDSGTKVLSITEVIELKDKRNLYIVASSKYGEEMYSELVEKGIDVQKILRPKQGFLIAERGKQYFDMWEPEKSEVYIDAGSFDGKTINDFIEWSHDSYKKIYALEPIPDMYNKIKKEFRHIDKEQIEILNIAAWNKKERLEFELNEAGSSVAEKGEIQVEASDLDSIVHDKITFIKMDIEGSERKALEGCKKIIVNDAPKLAICIYHKPQDVLEIASYILTLNEKYKFTIRHYFSNMWETVLFASVQE